MVDHEKTGPTTIIAGTRGYIAPELSLSGKFSDKSDVYAFGAVLLEIVCGRKALENHLAEEEMFLADWVWHGLSKGDLLTTVDEKLGRNYDPDWVEVVLMIGLLCSHPDPLARPTMLQVVQILAGDALVPDIPTSKPRAVYLTQASNISHSMLDSILDREISDNLGSSLLRC
jgi:serine/threonine protein kinase